MLRRAWLLLWALPALAQVEVDANTAKRAELESLPGYYAPPIPIMAVPKNKPRIRFFISALHTQAEIVGALDVLAAMLPREQRRSEAAHSESVGGLPLGFASPLVLLGLLSLPVLWWLLRLIPPRPQRIQFPPARLLFDIAPKEETPARTPWWLTLLRLSLAALLILAAAGPVWNPSVATSGGSTALALLIDDGWAAAPTWDATHRVNVQLTIRGEPPVTSNPPPFRESMMSLRPC